MPNNFDDYEYKDTTKCIKLKLKQIEEKKLNPWEVSSFLNKFNTYYYKAELLNTIAIALNQKIEPENIIIFNQSFKLNQQYSKLDFISTIDSDLTNLYYIGLPISLFPDEDIYTLNILFKYFRKYYELLKKIKKASTLKAKKLSIYYTEYKKSNFNDMFILIETDIQKCTKNNILLKNSERLEFKELDKNFKAEYDKYKQDKAEIEVIKNKLINNKANEKDFKSKIFIRYFTKFYTYLNNVQRPLVIVNNKGSNIMSVLCRAQFNKSASMASTLDLELISHNSPFEAIINGGSQLLSIFISGDRQEGISEREKKKEELKSNIIESNTANDNLLVSEYSQELKNIEKEQETLRKIYEAEKLTNADEIKSIKIPHTNNMLQHLFNNNQSLSSKLLEKNNFKPDLVKTLVCDYDLDIET